MLERTKTTKTRLEETASHFLDRLLCCTAMSSTQLQVYDGSTEYHEEAEPDLNSLIFASDDEQDHHPHPHPTKQQPEENRAPTVPRAPGRPLPFVTPPSSSSRRGVVRPPPHPTRGVSHHTPPPPPPPHAPVAVTTTDSTPVTSNSRRCCGQRQPPPPPPPPLPRSQAPIHDPSALERHTHQPEFSSSLPPCDADGFLVLDGSHSPPSKKRYSYAATETPSLHVRKSSHASSYVLLQTNPSRDGTATTASLSSGLTSVVSSTIISPNTTMEDDGGSTIPTTLSFDDDDSPEPEFDGEESVAVVSPGPSVHKTTTTRTTTPVAQALPSLSTLRAAKQKAKQVREARHLELRKLQAEIDWQALKNHPGATYRC